ncbi:MAG: hypothetical protein QM784_37520 [Polyangiaceae bacterium]
MDDAEDGLLKSPHHYENLMAEDITHVGIGIVKGGVVDPRNLTVTQVFSTPGKRESNAEATAAIVRNVTQARAASGVPALARLPELDRLACEGVGEGPRGSRRKPIEDDRRPRRRAARQAPHRGRLRDLRGSPGRRRQLTVSSG